MSYKRDKYKKRKYEDEDASSYKRYKERKKEFIDYKYELNNFLVDQVNIRNAEDFWSFYEKYKKLQSVKRTSDVNKSKLLNFTFAESSRHLYNKLPTSDRRGDQISLSYEDFKEFLQTTKIYQDFQQKTTFAKLKKLRATQNELPIAEYKTQIIDTLKINKVLLIAGDTGCGKSTQVPQYVYEAGYEKIVCTQPRRIACISLAKRVAYETLTEHKTTVGYQIRFEKTKRADTNIIFMTEGLLLRQTNEEDLLNSYDVIILDEVHERHLHGDFLVGLMKCLLCKNDKFKLILMSATINLKLFQEYFAHEQVATIQVPGRLYPIEIHYMPIIKDPYERKNSKFNWTPYLKILQMIDEKHQSNEKGDVLIFLNGFYEISSLADAVTEYAAIKKNWIVLPLHSSLPLEDQDKVFDYPPEGVRKCIISTNIAETSITIDGIRFVIDSGKVNQMSFLTVGGINKLCEVSISQDSAKQRAGRAGRTGPGICYRLYSEEDFSNFEPFTPAEIHLVPLESIMLNMITLGLSDISNFPFLEKPSNKSIEESLEKLRYSGALQLDGNALALTPLGEALNQLPVDLSIGKMLVMSTVFDNVMPVLALAALLSVQSPINQFANAESRASFESNHGDPITLLNIYKEWLLIKQKGTVSSKNKESSRHWARKHGLEEQRLYEATKLIQQFKDILEEARLIPKDTEEAFSSSERRIRYGELKQLRTLRRELKNESKTSRRKQLKFNDYDDDNENKTDLRDVEFRITNDFKKLQRLLNETSTVSYKDLTILKLILTSGFYPQVSVEDEFNSSKSVSEHLYHTKNKNYVFLRPNSYFAVKPEILELHNDDIEVPPPGYFSRRPISKKHQILIYQSILETKKVYLVNTMRMNALQTLLLFSKSIATNSTLTRFVFDDFLLMDVPYFGQGKTLLLRAIDIRKKWKINMEKRLQKMETDKSDEIDYFTEELVKFMTTDVSYNVKRLLPADIKVIYTNEATVYEILDTNPFDDDYKASPNKKFGGINVTENVIYNSLVLDEWDSNLEVEFMSNPYTCRYCDKNISGITFFKMLQHEALCFKQKKTFKSEPVPQEVPVTIKSNSKDYHCDKCDKDLKLTPIEILRHKKSCQ